jgi:glycosyltransferase involved in cell wall biosynthesis
MPLENVREKELAEFTQSPSFNDEIVLGRDANWPRMTILTPTLNQAQYIERTILSVLNQNYPNLEYMILDGGSTDGTLAIVDKYKRYLSYSRSMPDAGQAAALKEGFERATGEIFAWVNSDDMYLPGVFRQIGGIMRTQCVTDVCYGNMYLLSSTGRLVGERRLTGCSSHVMKLGIRHGGFGVYQPAAFWRRTLYEQVGGIDPLLHFDMDNDLFIRFVLHGGCFTFVPRALIGFRIHEASKTFQLQDQTKSEIPKLIKRYRLDHSSVKGVCLRTAVRLYRACRHLIQGDAWYLMRRLLPSPWRWVS